MNLFIRPLAEAEFENVYEWYEQQCAGLGEEFLQAAAYVLEAIQESPNRYPVIYRQTRRAVIQRFPYSIFYRVVGQDIYIVSCFHGHRDPRHWTELE